MPSLASSVYGKDWNKGLDVPDRAHARIAHVKAEFYRRNGINVESAS